MLIGLLGKPSCGKSTFFKAATLAEVEIAPHPFTTIKSQEGVAFVKIKCMDKEFNVKCNPRYGYCINSNRFIPVRLMDIPGLIENAHLGEGLGFEFLNDIREADALIHIIDISGGTDKNGNIVPALSHNPLEDVKLLEKELDYWYLSILKKGWDKFSKTLRNENQNIKQDQGYQRHGSKNAFEHGPGNQVFLLQINGDRIHRFRLRQRKTKEQKILMGDVVIGEGLQERAGNGTAN